MNFNGLTKEEFCRCLELDAQLAQTRAAHWHAIAMTGAYKQRKVFRGDGVEFTDDEKLKDVLETANRHIMYANELLDNRKSALRGNPVYQEDLDHA